MHMLGSMMLAMHRYLACRCSVQDKCWDKVLICKTVSYWANTTCYMTS